ncbi:MAG: hypothetical protein ACPLRY_03145 [Candidatus Bathyarchaeales archaeon]
MKRRIILTGVFLLLSFFVANAHGDGGVILQSVQKPAPEQAYERLETVELWLVHSPESIQNREVEAVIDGKEIALSLKNVTFCELWQMSAEVWAANISFLHGEHICQYFYVQSVKQSDGFWIDFQVQTTNPFKFYIVGDGQPPSNSEEPQTQVEENAKNENLTETSVTLGLDLKTVSVCLLLAAGLVACIVKARSKLTTCRKHTKRLRVKEA